MDDIKLEKIEGEPSKEDKDVMIQGLLSHHADKGHVRKTTTFSFLLKNQEDKVVGMVIATVLWNGMEINSLWVDESIRNQGWGEKLMNIAEEEGKNRGCTVSYTNTFDWQAPKFYEKLGYTLYGKLDDFPKGSSLSYYSKQL